MSRVITGKGLATEGLQNLSPWKLFKIQQYKTFSNAKICDNTTKIPR